jgi:hypothetical protein
VKINYREILMIRKTIQLKIDEDILYIIRAKLAQDNKSSKEELNNRIN